MIVFAGKIDVYFGTRDAKSIESDEPLFENEMIDFIKSTVAKNNIKLPIVGKVVSYLTTADFSVTNENSALTVIMTRT